MTSFDKHWPKDIELQVFAEEAHPAPRNAYRSLWDCPGARSFAERHADHLAANGKVQMGRWKPSEARRGYSFKHDAYKFFKQILIPETAAQGMGDDDIIIWLDGDVVSIRDIPGDFIARMMEGYDLAYLGRREQHSEIGFWALRTTQRGHDFLTAIADMYRDDKFLTLSEWHSAFVWDYVRRQFDFAERNLAPPMRGHVWPNTILGRYTIHEKGARKGAIK